MYNYSERHIDQDRTTVVWEISVFNNFRVLKFRTGKFSYNFVRKCFKPKFYRLKNFNIKLKELNR